MTSRRQGLALLLAVGVLGILAVLALAFVTLARLERRASLQRLLATQALLLARSGLEDALARLSVGQAPEYGGEDWDGSGVFSDFEKPEEVHQPGIMNLADCPVRHAMRPSFFIRPFPSLDPALERVDGRLRGSSGGLFPGGAYALGAEDLNGRIHVNGGDLSSNSTTPDGPNGFLVRLLDNLELVLTGTSGTPSLGVLLVGGRPPGGYRSDPEVAAVLGAAYPGYRDALTLVAWVDPSVVRPQPAAGRPHRWTDIDAAHQSGAQPASLSGVVPAGPVTGAGTEADPWTAQLSDTNAIEGLVSYPVRWERDFIYAWRQLRLGPVAPEPRAPIAVNGASEAVLAAAFLGLKGTYLETWDGQAGWDSGFGFALPYGVTYPYPSGATEEAPWFRCRADYGMPYGSAGRPWYGPSGYDPGVPVSASGGKPLIRVAPLGRLRETPAITLEQARALARQVRDRVAQAGPFRTWAEFDAFVDQLPRWEEVDEDADLDGAPDFPPVLDGAPYTVNGSVGAYARRRYEREDADSDGDMDREVFTVASGSWGTADIAWMDLRLLPVGAAVPGLTFVQKDVLRAMANPNTDLNDFNPDANLFKEVDKTDLSGHTTELGLDLMGYARIRVVGRVLAPEGRLLALRQAEGRFRMCGVHRLTTQADFMADYLSGSAPLNAVFSGPGVPYPVSGNQPLVSYPEPQTVGGVPAAGATYDGQIGLGFIGCVPSGTETLQGELFDSLSALGSGDALVPDLRGPVHAGLVAPAGVDPGSLFPDGAYSERDASLRYPMAGNVVEGGTFSIACWVKPNWAPEASPGPHGLITISPGLPDVMLPDHDAFATPLGASPVGDIWAKPVGLFFVPARNNHSQDGPVGVLAHDGSTALGAGWASRNLLWGATHYLCESGTLNRRGILNGSGAWTPAAATLPAAVKPLGRLEARRWQHLAVLGSSSGKPDLVVGAKQAVVTIPQSKIDTCRRGLQLDHNEPGGGTTPNHVRFGALASEHNMNYVADATFANVRIAGATTPGAFAALFTGSGNPAVLGRYYKETDPSGAAATYVAPVLPPAASRILRLTWTEVPCELWFDLDADGWLGDDLPGTAADFVPLNDRFGPLGSAAPDGRRDARILLELWDATGLKGSYEDAGGANAAPGLSGPVRLRAVFRNDWDDPTRLVSPLDVTPFLDDVTCFYGLPNGPAAFAWEEGA